MVRAILVVLFVGALCMATGAVLGVIDFRDVGYPDSSNVLRVSEFVQSGHLYPDFDKPPYLVTLYGPLDYVFLAVPYALARALAADPRILMRLAEVLALAACLCLVFVISRRISGERRTAWFCVLLAASSGALATWTTQLRPDLPGIACSFLAIYFCLRAERSASYAAAISAAAAILLKETFFAAPLAILVWLICQRRFKQAGQFLALAVLVAGGGYALALEREPLLLKHIEALRSAIFDLAGARAIIFDALRQPVTPLALFGAFMLLRQRTPEKRLILIYCLASWTVAMLTVAQAGANFNYFWEPLLASSIVAAAGLSELERRSTRLSLWGAAALLAVFAAVYVPAFLHDFYYLRRSFHEAASYSARKAHWHAMISVLEGKRLLSTFPDLAIHGAPPEMLDPFLNSELAWSGAWSPQPILDALHTRAYDVLITAKGEERRPQSYRGIPLWDEGIWSAAKDAYQPACALEDRFTSIQAWIPRGSFELLPALEAAGCVPVTQ